MSAIMDTAANPSRFPMIDTRQAREAYEKMNAAATETADLIKTSYSTALQGLQDYNKKLMEFGQANTHSAMDLVQKLSAVKSPAAFVELSTEQASKQFETFTEQAKQ